MNGFYKAVGYVFKNEEILKTALTHSSYANENNTESYERLEFLGDSILSVVVSEYLFKKLKDKPEGELTKIRAAAVCEQSLYRVAAKLSLGRFIYLNKGEEATGGRERVSILADVVEATIAAIYLDGGMEMAKRWILTNLSEVIEDAISGKSCKDYKTELQELAQGSDLGQVYYKQVSESGPPHMRIFEYEVYCGDKLMGRGKGSSKKDAEQSAAKKALEALL